MTNHTFTRANKKDTISAIDLRNIKATADDARIEFAELIHNLKYGSNPVDFSMDLGKIKKDKSWEQLKGFYECITQLMPQYNNQQLDQGKMEFLKDEFKSILKCAGGWYRRIEDKQGDTVLLAKSFKDITKEEMIVVLNNIQKWAIDNEFDLCIDKKLREIKN